jgi:hypothetical protein
MRAPRVKGHPPMPFHVSHVHLTRLQGVPDPLLYLPALPALPPSLKAPLTRRGDNDGQLEGNRRSLAASLTVTPSGPSSAFSQPLGRLTAAFVAGCLLLGVSWEHFGLLQGEGFPAP